MYICNILYIYTMALIQLRVSVVRLPHIYRAFRHIAYRNSQGGAGGILVGKYVLCYLRVQFVELDQHFHLTAMLDLNCKIVCQIIAN